jgi:hypothetical protein
MCLKCTVGCCNSVISLTQRPSEAFTRETRTHGRAIRSGAPRAHYQNITGRLGHALVWNATKYGTRIVATRMARDTMNAHEHLSAMCLVVCGASYTMTGIATALSAAAPTSLCDGLVTPSHFSARGKSPTASLRDLKNRSKAVMRCGHAYEWRVRGVQLYGSGGCAFAVLGPARRLRRGGPPGQRAAGGFLTTEPARRSNFSESQRAAVARRGPPRRAAV